MLGVKIDDDDDDDDADETKGHENGFGMAVR